MQHGDREDWPAPARGAGPHSLPDRARGRALRAYYADIFGGEVALEENPGIVALFLTEPLDRKAELRCYLRDPDGYLIEVGQATGMLEDIFAELPATA